MNNKTVVIFSGGMDSTALLWQARFVENDDVYALTFDYGQRHCREIEAAKNIAPLATVKHRVVDISSIKPLLGGSSQTDVAVDVPQGHYAEESMKQTVVPNRNMVMLAIATAWAVSLKAQKIAYAAHAGDHAIYPDCREEFAAAMSSAIALCDWHHVRLATPFITRTKSQIVADCVKLGLEVPWHMTYSCYNGRANHCGLCGTCVERKEAFKLAGMSDPTYYEA